MDIKNLINNSELYYNDTWLFLQFDIYQLSFQSMRMIIDNIENYNNNKIPFNNIDINNCYFKPNENSSRKLHCIQLQISLTSENLKILKEVYPYDYVLKKNNII